MDRIRAPRCLRSERRRRSQARDLVSLPTGHCLRTREEGEPISNRASSTAGARSDSPSGGVPNSTNVAACGRSGTITMNRPCGSSMGAMVNGCSGSSVGSDAYRWMGSDRTRRYRTASWGSRSRTSSRPGNRAVRANQWEGLPSRAAPWTKASLIARIGEHETERPR
jgi:hypothetical protein